MTGMSFFSLRCLQCSWGKYIHINSPKNETSITSTNVALLKDHPWPIVGRGCIFLSSIQRSESKSLNVIP